MYEERCTSSEFSTLMWLRAFDRNIAEMNAHNEDDAKSSDEEEA